MIRTAVHRIGCVVAVIGFLFVPAASRASFVASPMELHFEVKAGTEETRAVFIRNKDDAPLRLKIYLSDYEIVSTGAEMDREPGEIRWGCASWVRLSHQEMDLPPKGRGQLRVTLAVPPRASGSHWCKVYIEQVSKPKPRRQEKEGRVYQVFVMQRLGVRLYEEVPGTENRSAAVTNVSVHAPGGKEAGRVAVEVSNRGNCILHCEGRVEVRDAQGETVHVLRLGRDGRFAVFPGAARVFAAPLEDGLGPGVYSALAIVDFGAEHLVAGESIFEIPASGRSEAPVEDRSGPRPDEMQTEEPPR